MLRFTAALIALAFAASAHAQTPHPTCDAPEHRAFDFWIGEWDVSVTGEETRAGRSTIAREDKGCVITEHWRSARSDYSGRSVNLYDRATQSWRQFWVDSQGDVTVFSGNATPTGMQLSAENDVAPDEPRPHIRRMTFTRNEDGSVRQHGEASVDHGATWTTSYDFTYRPHRE